MLQTGVIKRLYEGKGLATLNVYDARYMDLFLLTILRNYSISLLCLSEDHNLRIPISSDTIDTKFDTIKCGTNIFVVPHRHNYLQLT